MVQRENSSRGRCGAAAIRIRFLCGSVNVSSLLTSAEPSSAVSPADVHDEDVLHHNVQAHQ